ncbi:MAG: DUF3857 and transglutaminase domain-containing protein [Planctomycetes bacterium]|nr:DUF3857 and transglutaminase domain-containing protein [Planctomycetota bacterium]
MPEHNFDLVILEDVKNVTINKDCSFTRHIIQRIKILTQKGMTAFSDQRFWYNTRSQDVEVLKAQTVTQDGRVIPITPHAVTDLLPPAFARAPGLCHVQEKLVCLIGLEINAVTELELKIADKSPRPFFAGEELVGTYFPAVKKEFSVTVPEDMQFSHSYRNGVSGISAQPEISSAAGMKTFKWSFNNVPALLEAENAPSRQELASVIAFAANPQNVAGAFAGRIGGSLARTSKQLKAKVKELTAGKKGVLDKVHAVYGYVQKSLNHIDISASVAMETAVCIPRAVEEIFMTHYANPVEKSVLLYAMLKTAGVKSEIAFGTDTEFTNPALPAQFNKCGVIVTLNKKPVWLDTTYDFSKAKNTRPTGDIAVLKKNGVRILPAQAVAAQDNTAEVRVNFAIDKDYIMAGTADFRFTGYFNPFWSFESGEKAIRDFVRQKLDAFGGKAEIKSLKIKGVSYPVMSAQARFEIADCFGDNAPEKQKQNALNLPRFTFDLPEWLIVTGREVPVKIFGPCRIKETFVISGPALRGRKAFIPAQREIDTDTGAFTGKGSYKSGRAVYVCALEMKEAVVPSARAEQAKALIDAYNENRNIVLCE